MHSARQGASFRGCDLLVFRFSTRSRGSLELRANCARSTDRRCHARVFAGSAVNGFLRSTGHPLYPTPQFIRHCSAL